MFVLPSARALSERSVPDLRALTLGASLILLPGHAFSQDTGEAAYEAYVKALQKYGVELKDGSVSYDAATDKLVLTDSRATFGGTISNLPEDLAGDDAAKLDPPRTTDLDYTVSLSAGTVTIHGLTHEDSKFSVADWTYSDDSKFEISGSVEGQGRAKLEGLMTGVSLTNYSFSLPDLPAVDPARQASRWLPFARSMLLSSYDAFTTDQIGMTIEFVAIDDGNETPVVTGTMQMNGYTSSNAVNGLIGEYAIDSMTQSLQTLDPRTGRSSVQTTSNGRTVYEGTNLPAFLDLFDPAVPETGDEVTLLQSISSIDYVSEQEVAPGLTLTMSIDEISADEYTLTKRDNNLLALLDDMLNKKAPRPEDVFLNLFQVYRSFGIKDARLSGFSMELPLPGRDKAFAMSVGEIAMTDFSSSGIGEMMVVGIDIPEIEGGSLKLDWASLNDIEFADFGPVEEMIRVLVKDPDYGEDHPLEIARAFIPRSLGYEIKGLDMMVPDMGRAQIGAAEMKVATTVPPIPTSFYAKSDGIRFPVKAVDDPQQRALLEALGLEEIVYSDETRLYWDEATLDLSLERLMLDIEGVGRAEISARFANVPKALFEDPEGQGQIAAIMAQFVDASIVFKDDGIASKGLTHIAGSQGIPENVFREVVVAQAAEATAPIQNEAFTNMVRDAVSEFLNDPKEIRVTMTPDAPVPLAQILGSLAAPQSLPDLLKVVIAAN